MATTAMETAGLDEESVTSAPAPSGGFVYMDGEFVPTALATVPLFDHGFLYGDGVFEGIRILQWARLPLGATYRTSSVFRALSGIQERAPDDRGRQRGGCRNLSAQQPDERLYPRQSDAWGGAGTGPVDDGRDATRLMIATRELRLYGDALYEQGLTMITCATRVPSPDVIDPRIKCTGKYINNILAKMEANRVGAGEGLMLNQLGHVAEATGDNLFIIKGGRISTPPPSAGCLKGITRAAAIDLAAEMGMTVIEETLTPYDVYTADECFLTGTAAEVIPAVSLDDRAISNGKPGDVTRRLIDAFRAHTSSTGTPVE